MLTAHTIGGPGLLLGDGELRAFVRTELDLLDLDGRSVCLVIPDGTRTCPLPLLLDALTAAIGGRARDCVAVIALGTHAPMTEDARRALVGVEDLPVHNHAWWDDATFATVGQLSAATVREHSRGLASEAVRIRLNRMILQADVTIIVGPVLPHEVVGFSGGEKYLFPGLSGPEFIDLTHWVGALITSSEIIGSRGITPVRALVHAAAELVPGERYALSVVVDHATGQLESVSFGAPIASWSAAADVAAETHVRYLPHPVRRVLSLVPERYEDLWTGAKGFYKVEPVVADGGEVVLYAPHITEIAAMHPGLLDIGYHCRDYFLAQWERFRNFPRGELAHSTHLYGSGTYDEINGEHQRVRVVLATGIPQEVVHQVNLGYLDPDQVDPAAWAADPDTLVVPDAGEVLYRLR